MNSLHSLLAFCARNARWVLVAGLLAGLALQSVADLFKPSIPWLIALLLFTASFRIGHHSALGALSKLRRHFEITLIMQLCLPLLLLLVVVAFGWTGVYVTAMLLVAAAAPISGSPNLVIMLGHEPAAALRQLVVGTALLPLTALPVFLWLPELGELRAVMLACLRLLLVITMAAAAGFALRAWWKPDINDTEIQSVDGLSAILMAVVVVGLMSALGYALRHDPLSLVLMLVFVFVLNFGLQWVGSRVWRGRYGGEYAVPLSVISGNRNVALYLTALPASVTDELLLFVGCYQFPMYLTPMLLRRFYHQDFSATSP
ncbi:MAG: hypothetical protein KTR33_08115 [Gammaproteobacteria bacterium]|nr:hypothetical protein [Gammaproteobacteria bacterium]